MAVLGYNRYAPRVLEAVGALPPSSPPSTDPPEQELPEKFESKWWQPVQKSRPEAYYKRQLENTAPEAEQRLKKLEMEVRRKRIEQRLEQEEKMKEKK